MPRLFLMRHAKSDWSAAAGDYERPLKKRGVKAAEKIGLWLAQQDIIPELIVSSPAVRAEHTARIICSHLGRKAENIMHDDRIYEADLDDLLTVISEYGKKAKHMLLTGHNPGLDELVDYLSRDEPQRNKSGKLMTTAAIAILDYTGDSIKAEKHSARLVQIARPGDI